MTILAPASPLIGSAASKADYRTIVYLTLLSLAAAWFLAWPIWRAQFLIEIWPTEAWNGYFQDAAAKGLPLYPAVDGLVGNNYPPLSFYGIGLLGKALGIDNLFVGRAVSVTALLAIAIEIFLAVRVVPVALSRRAIACSGAALDGARGVLEAQHDCDPGHGHRVAVHQPEPIRGWGNHHQRRRVPDRNCRLCRGLA